MIEVWAPKTIGECVKITKGVTYASSDYASEDDGHVFLTIKCFSKGGGFNSEGVKYFRGIYAPDQEIEPGELLVAKTDLTRDGDIIGSPMIAPDFGGGRKVLPSMDLSVLRPLSTETDRQFLFYRLMLGDARRFMWAHSAGSTVLHLESKSLPKFKFKAPRPIEQRRIAEILSTVDEAIEQTEALLGKWQQMKAGLMHDLFTRGVTPEGHLRPTRTQAPHLYQNSPLGWIPKDWEPKFLRDVATYQHGQPFPSADYSDEGVLLLRPGNLHVSGIVRFDVAHTTRLPDRWLRTCPELVLKPDDIVMNLTAQSLDDEFHGRVCIVKESEPSLLNQRIARFFPREVNRYFLYWVLRSLQFRNHIDRTTQGTKVQHIYNSDLNRVVLGIPKKIEEQERIHDVLQSITDELFARESEVAKLRQQKKGLMHDLLTGSVRVSTE